MLFETEHLIVAQLKIEDTIRFHQICNKPFVLKWMNDWKHCLDESYANQGYMSEVIEKAVEF